MLTTVLKLPTAVIGDDFERLNVLQIPLNINGASGKTGYIRINAAIANKSYLTITGGNFYSDATFSTSLGNKVPVPTTYAEYYYFRIEQAGARIDVDNVDNINAIGGTDYLFGDSSANAGGYVYTKDFYKMNLVRIWTSRNMLIGKVSEIPETVNDLRVEVNGLEGDLTELKPRTFATLRFRQTNVTGKLSDISDLATTVLILDCPQVTGDVVDLLPLNSRGLLRLEIGNAAGSGTTGYPLTCSLNESIYFGTMARFAIQNIRLNRASLLNTLKSLAKTNWQITSSGVSNKAQVKLTTTMTESDYNADSEIQAAKAALILKGQSANLELIMYFV